jgi:threonine dehydratase
MTVTIDAIRDARAAIAATVRLTPCWPSTPLTAATGYAVLLKCEQMQLTGSFKLRGALNFVRQIPEAACARGLVAASAGNHAQGVAYAGAARGIPVTVVMPASAPLAKVNATREYGASVVLHGVSLEEARTEALAIADRTGALYVPPFDDDSVIAGQGTIGLEILEQVPDVEEVLVPAGGGGLLSGIAVAVKALRPSVRVVGVQAHAMDGICRSFAAHRVVQVPHERTIADGVAVAGPSERTFALIEQFVDEMVSVGDEAIAHAIVMLIERSKMVAEGAGALAVAALHGNVYRPKGQAVAVISGGNIDINLIGSIVRRGLVDAGRYQQLTIEVSDTPGELALVTAAIAAGGGNILEVEHNREAPHLPVGVALLELVLEVNGEAHFQEIIHLLRERGLRGVPGNQARLATVDARRRHEQE